MYGKHFLSMYEGSMCGSGAIRFAVWGYIIAHTVDSHIEINPKIVAFKIGCKEDEILEALGAFQSPDPSSRNKEHNGKKLIKTGEYEYFVTGWERYNRLQRQRDRREYQKLLMRDLRAKNVSNVSQPVSMLANVSLQEEEEEEEEVKEKAKGGVGGKKKKEPYSQEFLRFWIAYPKRIGKGAASKSFGNLKPDTDEVLKALSWQIKTEQWQKDNGSFIPHPATYLNQRRWEDEPPEAQKAQTEAQKAQIEEKCPTCRNNTGLVYSAVANGMVLANCKHGKAKSDAKSITHQLQGRH